MLISLLTIPQWVPEIRRDRKSTRLNSSHGYISYAVFCLKKKSNITYFIRRWRKDPSSCRNERPPSCQNRTFDVSDYSDNADARHIVTFGSDSVDEKLSVL